jgi:hypothetical protein
MHLAQDRDQWQSYVHDNEPSGFINGGEFLDWLSDCQLLKKDSAPCS